MIEQKIKIKEEEKLWNSRVGKITDVGKEDNENT